jgi:hypothetical protein
MVMIRYNGKIDEVDMAMRESTAARYILLKENTEPSRDCPSCFRDTLHTFQVVFDLGNLLLIVVPPFSLSLLSFLPSLVSGRTAS